MKQIKKQVSTFHGTKMFLLGVGIDGARYWLAEPSWDCGWYWGFGYIQTFNRRDPGKASDIRSHEHWCNLGDHKLNSYDAFKSKFRESTLSSDELWTLCDLMESFYALKTAAEVFGEGGSHYSNSGKTPELKSKAYAKRINGKMLPAVFRRVAELLSPAEP